MNDNNNLPLLSICCSAYNHENYIARALDGFLMQKVNFPFEIIVHDDASTDNTSDIIREYANRHSQIIAVIQPVNLMSKGLNPTIEHGLLKARGKYIALCDGDDYWTDPYKLQKQVDSLEANPEYAICHHNMQVICDDGREPFLYNSPGQKELTAIEDLARENYISTSSCVFRNGLVKDYPDWFNDAPAGDYVLHMLNAQFGKIKYLPDVMGVYRVHKGGMWVNNDIVYRTEKFVELIDLMKNHFNPKINGILRSEQNIRCNSLIMQFQDNEEKSKYYSYKLIENDPYYISSIIKKIDDFNKINGQKVSVFRKIGRVVIKPLYYIKNIFIK